MKTKIVIIVFFLSFSISARAQKEYPLKKLSEYKKCNNNYQKWLKNIGLSDILSINKVDIYDEQLALYLQITGKNEQDKLNKWFSLRKYYEENKTFPIYEQLYKNMISIYKVSPDKANIQIWEGEYYYMIFYNDSTKKIEYEENKLKNKISYAEVNLKNTNITVYRIKDKQPNIYETKKAIYNKILDFSKGYFKNKVANYSRDFNAQTVKGTRPLNFTVNNMRQEVLYKEDGFFLCDMINWFYETDDEIDCRPREYLNITITVEIEEDIANIKCDITGKYASTFGEDNPEYYNDMEADFSYYLEIYTNRFVKEIENYLNKQ